MYMDLSGEWGISLEADDGMQSGTIMLPGILQACGYGNPVTRQTPWVSSLHDSFWYEQEEYKFGQEDGVNVPFLAQPPRHFLGQAIYERVFEIPEEMRCAEVWHFHAEAARWRSRVWIDGEFRGEDCSLCSPHDIRIGELEPGIHTVRVMVDNSMLYPYRPDAHSVSDALGGTWNGMVGEIALFTEDVYEERGKAKRAYAKSHLRRVETKGNRIYVDGDPFYFRATHFGGDFPLTGYPATDKSWWRGMMAVVKKWGLNGIRFHSYCPPEAAFAAADEMDICLLVECGMWNHFGEGPEGEEMYGLLKQESERILDSFGHHPSFVFFSSSNEPGGAWYKPLRKWVSEIRKYDESLGYGGRRIYTAQSGWFYDVPPAEIEGTDFIYFHRSGYGPYPGGTIRNPAGWKGGSYSPSLKGVRQPVICHELGQICAYPDYSVTEKFTGFLQPGNYRVFRENAGANGILPYAEDFVKCSGENQFRLYKEELEANYRTPEIQGFELLDLHDYLGQGTALVGILDPFWESKGYGSPEEFREFCGDSVLLAGCDGYVWKDTETAVIPVEICHYGKEDIRGGIVRWKLSCEQGASTAAVPGSKRRDRKAEGERILQKGELQAGDILRGGNTKAGRIVLNFEKIMKKSVMLYLTLELLSSEAEKRCVLSVNRWKLYLFQDPLRESVKPAAEGGGGILYTREWAEAKAALEAGGKVVFSPYLSDLNYECPALSGQSVSWNSQMGPAWCRTMGIVVNEKHPIFRHFPTEHSGGWQWEDILDNARGFHMEGLEQVRPIVQPIDDWNRNLLQSLIFEAGVLNGSLLFVSANLEGTFEERPAAYCLKQAIMAYAASEEFLPAVEAAPEAIERKLFPMLRMEALTEKISYEDAESAAEEGAVKVTNGNAITEADPGRSVRIEKAKFPISVTIMLRKPVVMQGILYVPEQRDRGHEGFVRDYTVEVRSGKDGCWEKTAEGTFRNTCRSQNVLFDRKTEGDALRLTVYSAYGCVDGYVWQKDGKGWHRVFSSPKAVVQIAGLHIICDEDAPHRDSFSAGERKSRTKEIE